MVPNPIEATTRREQIGIAGVLLLALFAWSSTTGAAIALAMLVIAFAVDRQAWLALRENALFWPLAALMFYLVVRSLWAAWELPDTARLQMRQFGAWFRLALFVAIAWWLGGSPKRINWVLALALAGLIIGMVLDVDWDRLPEILAAQDVDRHGINRHPNPFALYVSTGLLGLSLFAPQLIGPRSGRWRFVLRLLLWLLVVAVLLEWLVLTRTRSAWLGVAVVFPSVFAVYLVVSARHNPAQLRKRLTMAALVLAALVVALLFNWTTIAQRIADERQSITAIAEGRIEHLPRTSVVYRINAYRFGVEKWLERPLVGWGPGSMRHVIDNSGREELKHPSKGGRLDWIDHLHNTYLEYLVRFGLVGAALALAVVVILLRQTYAAYRAGQLPLEHALLVFGAFGLMAVWDMFDFRLDHFDMRHYWLLLAGIAATHAFRAQRAVGGTLHPSGE